MQKDTHLKKKSQYKARMKDFLTPSYLTSDFKPKTQAMVLQSQIQKQGFLQRSAHKSTAKKLEQSSQKKMKNFSFDNPF